MIQRRPRISGHIQGWMGTPYQPSFCCQGTLRHFEGVAARSWKVGWKGHRNWHLQAFPPAITCIIDLSLLQCLYVHICVYRYVCDWFDLDRHCLPLSLILTTFNKQGQCPIATCPMLRPHWRIIPGLYNSTRLYDPNQHHLSRKLKTTFHQHPGNNTGWWFGTFFVFRYIWII